MRNRQVRLQKAQRKVYLSDSGEVRLFPRSRLSLRLVPPMFSNPAQLHHQLCGCSTGDQRLCKNSNVSHVVRLLHASVCTDAALVETKKNSIRGVAGGGGKQTMVQVQIKE
ncbi:hypothetical protein LOAG_11410 [Loa loa]|uniref:Uncharacterized protein n=1 Tax=Loa loa TaxID=7209 RepID=A0A1S0TN53_LOALO|nr:hypothetical protein LOAG_11410 [Loa loa]EFO17090.1 hypothetical protein LOAG_11410 [Loa loa]